MTTHRTDHPRHPDRPGRSHPADGIPAQAAPPAGAASARPAADPTAHLTPALWERATRHLLRKALAEFAHERLLAPVPDGSGWAVDGDDGRVRYRFRAQRLALDHWHIDPSSLTRHRRTEEPGAAQETGPAGHPGAAEETGPARTPAPADPGEEAPLDLLAFLTEFRRTLGLSDAVLPVYLEETTATLSSLAFRYAAQEADREALSARALARAGQQTVEAAMTEGHPCFVANSGRLGFGAADLLAYAPEAACPVRLRWVAARRDLATFSAGEGTSYEELIAAELDPAVRDRFDGVLRDRGLDPSDYLLIPVHPWQWDHKLAVTFAGEVAQHRLVPVGRSEDTYLPQQSIRTFFNTDRPDRHYVKTALSVLNMGFMRGLSAAYMKDTPAINDWLAGLVAKDTVLAEAGFSIIRERAAVGYHPLPYEAATAPGSPYRKMLAALWRESPVPGLAPGQSAATMAALLHLDADGRSYAAALIERSGEPPERWLRGYLDAYLVPVVHCLYAYDLAFMPHGENVILVLDQDGRVARTVFKDIAEEIAVLSPDMPLPPRVERIRSVVPEDQWALPVLTDVVDCFLRFLSAVLHTGDVLDQEAFWHTVAGCLADYQGAHPELAERFARHDLFAPRFPLSCLNRLQLRDNTAMLDLADPTAALQFAGTLENPLHPFRPAR